MFAPSVTPNFGPMPNRMCLRLKRTDDTELSLAGGVHWSKAYGLFDYLNQLPFYAATLYQLYRYTRINRVEVNLMVTAIPGGTAYGAEAAIGRVAWSDFSTSMDPKVIALTRNAKFTKIGLYGGTATKLQSSWCSQNVLGSPVYGEEVWQTLSQATSTSPTDGNKPVIVCALGATGNGTINLSVSFEVFYHIEFFDLDSTPFTLRALEPVEESEDDEFSKSYDLPLRRAGLQTLPRCQAGKLETNPSLKKAK